MCYFVWLLLIFSLHQFFRSLIITHLDVVLSSSFLLFLIVYILFQIWKFFDPDIFKVFILPPNLSLYSYCDSKLQRYKTTYTLSDTEVLLIYFQLFFFWLQFVEFLWPSSTNLLIVCEKSAVTVFFIYIRIFFTSSISLL